MVNLNTEEAAWTKGQPAIYGNGNSNILIGNIIPAHFEAYCKILYPFTIFHDLPANLIPEENKDNRITHIDARTGKWVEGTFVIRRKKGEGTSTRQNEVAEKYGLPFNEGTTTEDFVKRFDEIGWPENILFPLNGRVWADLLSIIISVLKQYAVHEKVRIYQSTPNSIWRGGEIKEELVECTFDEVLDYLREYFIGHLFPLDQSWIVYTDDDLPYTIVGGPGRLIEWFMASPWEVLRCDAETVVTNKD